MAQEATKKNVEEILRCAANDDGLFTSASFQVGSLDKSFCDVTGGYSKDAFIKDNQGQKAVVSELVFDLSSMTKALVTTPLLLEFAWSRGKSETTNLGNLFSQRCFEGIAQAANLSLLEVLRHESGLPAWRNFYVTCEDKHREVVDVLYAALEKDNNRGKNIYSDVGMILLSLLLERELGQSLSEIFHNWTLSKLNFETRARLGESNEFFKNSCVPTGFCPVRSRELVGEVHDENAFALGGFCGHSGLFGSLNSVSEFIFHLVQSQFGVRFLTENLRWINEETDSALGWRTAKDPSSAVFGEGKSIGHMGFTGTAFWINPINRSYAILLTNRVCSGRTSTLSQIKKLRNRVFSESQGYVNLMTNASSQIEGLV